MEICSHLILIHLIKKNYKIIYNIVLSDVKKGHIIFFGDVKLMLNKSMMDNRFYHRFLLPSINSSTISTATSSVNCSGGCFMV